MSTEHDKDPNLHLLRALCQTTNPVLLRRAVDVLRRHRWPQGEPLVVYESCAALAARGARITRGNLAAELTRAGFPDVDLDSLFAPLPSPESELARHLETLEKENG
jgi:hypothetical protein